MKIFKNSLKIDFNILKVFKKSLSRPQNIRVGRVTGNKTFSFLALGLLQIIFPKFVRELWPFIYAKISFLLYILRATGDIFTKFYINFISAQSIS